MRFLPQRVTLAELPALEQLLNDMLAKLRMVSPRSSPTVRVNESANGTTWDVIERGGGGGGGSNISPMQVSAWTVGNDYLTAKAFSFTTGATGPDLKVALPWDLRVAQSPGGSLPIVYPAYAAGNILYVLTAPTGVTVLTQAVGLIDTNQAGRQWAQRTSYKNTNCTPVHRYVVGSVEMAGG